MLAEQPQGAWAPGDPGPNTGAEYRPAEHISHRQSHRLAGAIQSHIIVGQAPMVDDIGHSGGALTVWRNLAFEQNCEGLRPKSDGRPAL